MDLVKSYHVFLLILFVFLPLASTTCYFPDGSIATNQAPCSDLTLESACCGEGYACLNNNLCKATGYELPFNGNYSRGGCTDRTWRSASCSTACLDQEVDVVDAPAEVVRCKQYTRDVYYCARDKHVGECKTGYWLISYPEAESAYTTIGVGPSTTTSSTSTSIVEKPTSTSFTTLLSASVVKATASASSTAPTASGSKSVYTQADQDRHLAKLGSIIGVSVGGACVLAIVSVSMCWFLGRGPYKRSNAGDDETAVSGVSEDPAVLGTKEHPAELMSEPIFEAP